jgi:hypothetical protein
MWKSKRTFVGLLIFSLASCTSARNTETTWENKELGSFPYHPVVYHLDLCALSYQLYAQTLVWPFDPYYEEMSNWDYDRTKYMRKVRDWADEQGAEQVRAKAGLGAYRGPGTLGGYDANENHDPLLFRYDRLHPWVPSYTNPSTKAWDVVKAPDRITDRIGDLFVCYRTTAGAPGDVSLEPLPPKGDDRKPDAPDVLLAFEGGTGAKGDAGRPTSQSLMGFVLLRTKDTGGYDLHVVFRASRSGSLFRALTQAAKHKEEGNPDWITDLGYNQLDPQSGAPISTVGTVSRGFAHAMIAILPQLFGCLEKVSEIRKGAAPDQIYVTGHSLGGALTQHFVSAVLLGNRYGPGGIAARRQRGAGAHPGGRGSAGRLLLDQGGAAGRARAGARRGGHRWATARREQARRLSRPDHPGPGHDGKGHRRQARGQVGLREHEGADELRAARQGA